MPSGRSETLSAPHVLTVGRLRSLIQKSFGQRFLRLVKGTEGHVFLDPLQSLEDAGIQDQDHIIAIAQQAKLEATDGAFALWYCGGDGIVSWGVSSNGGDSSQVQNQLKNVQEIHATCYAFAAILIDGSIVTWGDPFRGGDSSEVQYQLINVKQLKGTSSAFAAILVDGSVVTWGSTENGADSSQVQHQLQNVQQIQANMDAFAAILADGSVVTWGDSSHGGDSTNVQDRLKDVQQIQSVGSAFAAILGDGSVVTWGKPEVGGDSSSVQDELKDVQPQVLHLLRFWQMDQWSHGVHQRLVVTAHKSRSSSET